MANMLPTLAAFIAPFACYQSILAMRVVRIRRGNRISLDTEMRSQSAEKPGIDPLKVAIRAHSNFVEGVPLALLIAGVAELNGASKRLLALSLGILFVGRVLHVEYGLLRNKYAAGVGRTLGTMITQVFITSWGLGCLYLVRDSIFEIF